MVRTIVSVYIKAQLTLSLKRNIDVLEHLHRVRPAALLLRVEEDVALLGHAPLDHLEQHRAERRLHVRADPDEEPVVELHARRAHRADARARADRDAAAVQVAEVRQTRELEAEAEA